MNPRFPFPAKFDRDRIRRDVEDARKAVAQDARDAYVKAEGLRFVVEAPDHDAKHVGMMAQEIWGIGVESEPLFPQDLEPPASLRGFYLVTVRGVAFGELGNNPYDLAYALLGNTEYASVEPDFPYLHFPPPPGGGAPPPAATVASTDQAWALRRLRADAAWQLAPAQPQGSRDGRGIAIAHLDTGWTTHRDLDVANIDMSRAHDLISKGGNAEDPLNYTGNPGHGTRTGSVMMSDGGVNYPIGTIPTFTVTGVARHATHIPVRCIESVIFTGKVAVAVRYATSCKADIVSMSLGGIPLRALRFAIEDATDNHLLVVCAAGNHVRVVVWPARYKASIALAATNEADQPWSGSSRGWKVDVSAPGEDVWVADPDPAGMQITQGSGTSYATALTAGTAALWLAFHSKPLLLVYAKLVGVTLQELFRAHLRSTARVPGAGWDSTRFGTGIVDALALLQQPPWPFAAGARPPLPTDRDYIDDMRFHAHELLRTRLGSEASAEPFEHEFSKIFLDEINAAAKPVDASHDGARQVIGARGSMTLRSLLGL